MIFRRPEGFYTVCCAVLCFLLIGAWSMAASNQVVSIQVDGSGSMRGFYQSGELEKLLDEVQDICHAQDMETEMVFFRSNQPDEVTWEDGRVYLSPETAWGGYTNLDRAFVGGLGRAPIIVMITDNVQAAYDQDTQALYVHFTEDTVKVLHAVPLIRPFDGNLPNPLAGDRSSLQKLRLLNPGRTLGFATPDGGWIHYRGPRGAILYIYLTEKIHHATYNRLIRALRGSGMEPMLMKPIEKAIVLHRNSIPILKGRLDKPNRIQFNFALESRLQYINIESQDASGKSVLFDVETPYVYPHRGKDRPFLGGSGSFGRVNPPRLAGLLESNTQNRYVYQCLVQLGPFRPSYRGFFHRLGLARIGSIPAQYQFTVALNIPPDSFRMTPAYENRYFTDSAGVLDHIYTPLDPIRYLNPKGLKVAPEGGIITGELSVKPPLYPWIAWGELLFFPIAFVVAAIMIGLWPLKYRLMDEFFTKRLRPFGGHTPLSYENAIGDRLALGCVRRQRLFMFRLVPADDAHILDPVTHRAVVDEDAEESPPGVLLERGTPWLIEHRGNEMEFERLGRSHDNAEEVEL